MFAFPVLHFSQKYDKGAKLLTCLFKELLLHFAAESAQNVIDGSLIHCGIRSVLHVTFFVQ